MATTHRGEMSVTHSLMSLSGVGPVHVARATAPFRTAPPLSPNRAEAPDLIHDFAVGRRCGYWNTYTTQQETRFQPITSQTVAGMLT